MVSRLEDGSWSAPSAIACLGVGYGAQAGLQFTDLVIVLREAHALNAFSQLGNITFGAELALTLGPFGRSAEGSVAATCALTYSFSKSRGLFGGLSLEGAVFFENRKINEACYGKGVSARQILGGQVPVNDQVAILNQALNTRFAVGVATTGAVATITTAANITVATTTSSYSTPSVPAVATIPGSSSAAAAGQSQASISTEQRHSSVYPAPPPAYKDDEEEAGMRAATDDKTKLLSAAN